MAEMTGLHRKKEKLGEGDKSQGLGRAGEGRAMRSANRSLGSVMDACWDSLALIC